jgi:hypothetical protein
MSGEKVEWPLGVVVVNWRTFSQVVCPTVGPLYLVSFKNCPEYHI